jgi:hypothetical protein
MRRLAPLAVLTAAACLVPGSAPAHPAAPTAPAATLASVAHLRVVQVEYRLGLSVGVIKAGPVDLEAIDRGHDPHDLHLQALGSSSQLAAPQLTPGESWSGTVNLKPGVYRLWCSLPEHARLGMHTTLKVVR